MRIISCLITGPECHKTGVRTLFYRLMNNIVSIFQIIINDIYVDKVLYFILLYFIKMLLQMSWYKCNIFALQYRENWT